MSDPAAIQVARQGNFTARVVTVSSRASRTWGDPEHARAVDSLGLLRSDTPTPAGRAANRVDAVAQAELGQDPGNVRLDRDLGGEQRMTGRHHRQVRLFVSMVAMKERIWVTAPVDGSMNCMPAVPSLCWETVPCRR
ncbi:MAG: hypothetical protein ABW000_05590 [Actinoplanes sp.]